MAALGRRKGRTPLVPHLPLPRRFAAGVSGPIPVVPLIPPAPFSVPGSEGKFRRVHAVVRRVPEGRVTTYGRVARAVTAAGYPLSARAAGWALRNSPEGVPWHRVVNAEGALSAELSGNCEPGRQRALLAGEGVPFDERGRVRLDRCLFDPADSDAFFFPDGEASP
ncbi:MAG: hypothetical protein F4Y71_00245 [Acidobacteria bacterium]|nr:hypothetical protein [Acidobacteriota bacterium]MYG76094.1 hypothetical protein [Acidobacteriota bacterium]